MAAENPITFTKVGVFSLRSEEHTSELQSQSNLVCRLLLEKKHHVVGQTRRIEFESVRIVDIQIGVERPAGEAESAHSRILEADDRLSDSAESQRGAPSHCD